MTGLGHCAQWFWRWSLKNDFGAPWRPSGLIAIVWLWIGNRSSCEDISPPFSTPFTVGDPCFYWDKASESVKLLLLLLYNSCHLLLRINRWNGTFCLNVSFIFLGWISAMAFPCSAVLSGNLSFLLHSYIFSSLLIKKPQQNASKQKRRHLRTWPPSPPNTLKGFNENNFWQLCLSDQCGMGCDIGA